MFEKFTEGAIKVIMLSQEEARRMGHNFVGTEQLFLGVVGQRQGLGAKALRSLGVTLKKARKEVENYIGRGSGFVASEIPFTPRAKRVLEMAVQEGKDIGQNYVGTEHILLALIAEEDGVAIRTIEKLGVDIVQLRNKVLSLIKENQEELLRPLTDSEKRILDRDGDASSTPTLDEYTDNITKDAVEGRLDPVIGRDKEIFEVIKVLARRSKNNPVLIGEPGVGKTAVAEGLAQLILTQDIPNFLEGNVIMSLDLGSLLAGTKYRGEFEERLKRIVEEAQMDNSIILVIDEIHTLVGAGAAEGAVDAANILKPALARGKLRCIGATTMEEYRKYIERDAALERRFQPVQVEEPSIGVTIDILRGLRSKFERHHSLSYHDKAIEQAAILADKFIADRYLPDKAIDVLDEAGSRVRLENKRLPEGILLLLNELQETLSEKDIAVREQDYETASQLLDYEMEVRIQIQIMKQALQINEKAGLKRVHVDMVMEEDIAEVISGWTGIPMTKISETESKKLLNMEEILHERLIGQHQAIVSVSKAIRRARVGLRNPDRPIASFIFAGPTGVGKTELTKALASYMFGSEETMVRLDMSEYMEKHTVAKLIGSPPGYVGYSEGGQLTEAVRSKPYTVVLFDEVEKAHPDVFNLLLQILDDGRLTDSKGRTIDFKNTLIIMTSNVGAKIIEKESGIQSRKPNQSTLDINSDFLAPANDTVIDPTLFKRITYLVNEELKKYFRPEFLNRLDEIIVFSHLTRQDVKQISEIMIKQLQNRMKEKEIELEVRNGVKEILVEQGFDPIYGARPLRRAVMRLLEDNLAQEFLAKPLYPKTKLIVDADIDDNIIVNVDYSHVDPKLRADEETIEIVENK
uniref:Clp protease ATP binding subunit n=1 Tax=Sundstroemia setigera TaxID=3005 RepID=A0A2U9NNA4_9STRA|nr:Clp protease ATP binding subunit [Rhizosolenia setigera]AWT38455.1 Clp protease ATP binding subunit [Rhizosolenia setigera]